MPIWLREFTYKQIKGHYDKQNEDPGNITLNSVQNPSAIKLPNFVPKPPTYVTKKKNS